MSFFRQFAAPALLTVFGTVSVLGTGLHLIPGCGHSHAPSHPCSVHDHACHHCSDEPKTTIGTTHDDCAICRFLAIPRALTSPPAIVDGGIHFEPLALAAAIQPAFESARPYGARAPPQASANV